MFMVFLLVISEIRQSSDSRRETAAPRELIPALRAARLSTVKCSQGQNYLTGFFAPVGMANRMEHGWLSPGGVASARFVCDVSAALLPGA